MSLLLKTFLPVQLFALAIIAVALPSATAQSSPDVGPDSDRVVSAGIVATAGRHITIFGDHANGTGKSHALDERHRQALISLGATFDAAVEQWCEAFGIVPEDARSWRMSAMVMHSRERFERAGLVPERLPQFPAGFALGDQLWIFAQQDDYYTRHLLLHEGTHAFMQKFLGGTGPPWFSEGMAEWMALHRIEDGRLLLHQKIARSQDAAGWGRIGIIKRMTKSGNAMTIDDVLNIPPTAFRSVEFYAWSWAACEFFASHPLTKDAFTTWPRMADRRPERFNIEVVRQLTPHRDVLDRDWALFIGEIDYGYDAASGISGMATLIGEHRWRVEAAQSWQSTGFKVQAGDTLQIESSGQTVLRETTRPWTSESEGVTIEYHAGSPIGKLMLGVMPPTSHASADSASEFPVIEVTPIGRSANVPVQQSGTVFLRINEQPGEYRDNSGHLEVSVVRLQ